MFDKRLMQICPESKLYIFGNIILQWIELCLNAVMIFSIALIIERLYEKTFDVSFLMKAIVVILFTIVVRLFTSRYAVRMSYLASKTVKQKIRELIYDKLLSLGIKYREHVSTAELMQESVEGVDQLESYFGQYVPQFFYAFIAPFTLFFLFGIFGSWSTATVLLICVPLIPGAIMMVQKIAKKLLSKYWGQYTELGSTFLENLQGMTTLKIYQADEYKNQEMNKESEHFRDVTMKVLTMQLNSIIIMDFFAYGGAAIGIVMATRDFASGVVSLSHCIFMILLSSEFFLPMRKLGSYFHVAMNGMAASDKIFKFLGIQKISGNEKDFDKDFSDLRLENVSFSYDEGREILHNVSLKIKRNSFTAVVGESGSGKSTIARLLMGQYTYEKGKVLYGRDDVFDISEKSLMENVTYIGHNSLFFKGSVRENMLIGNRGATDEEIWNAIDMCNLKEFFEGEKGLDTPLLENASNLSGGQRQRLGLARAILHDSYVYIFDEATSNIDVESEEIILKQIEKMSDNKTVIMITHRLLNVVNAGNIYVIEDGNIVESGDHNALINNNSTYANLWKVQSELEQYRKESK